MAMLGTDETATAARQTFSYEYAFSRNIGWITEAEQQILRRKRIAIAGCGGVGGSHLLTLTRLGIGAFNIADFDTFDVANFNRQAGANLSTVGKPKAETIAQMARDINPELDLKVFPKGVDAANLDEFLKDVDVYVDSLDFFVLEFRLTLFARLSQLGIPAVIAGPIGMGTGYLVFMPGKMTFEEYFRLEGLSPEHQAVNFALGLTPAGFHRGYMMDLSRFDLNGGRGPSTGLACELCAGVAAAEVLKIVLKRGSVRAAPWFHHFDAYRCKWKRGWLPWGNRNPWQRVKIAIARRVVERLSRDAQPPIQDPATMTDMEYVLDQARWAPSGDNMQPWRFDVQDEDRVIVLVRSTGDLFDYRDGEPTLLAAGTLLETMRLAATARRRSLSLRKIERVEQTYRILVELKRDDSVVPDPLIRFIPIRSVDRRPFRTSSLSGEQKATLAAALGHELTVVWRETLPERWRAAWINFIGAGIRLRLREAFEIHRRIIDWDRSFSPEGIPARAVGLDPLTRILMRHVMREWRRMDLIAKSGGTVLARLEMDLLPGLFCGTHFAIGTRTDLAGGDPAEFSIRTGQALQRFWLTATALGLALQPSFAPLWFAEFSRENRLFPERPPFTQDRGLRRRADWIGQALESEKNGTTGRIVFRGRLGIAPSTRLRARSVRLHLPDLHVSGTGQD
jgi:molybdopterin/thiamine biosynthesis adenylyltransferase